MAEAKKTAPKAKKAAPAKKAKATPKAAAPQGKPLRVKQVRSGIGHAVTYRRTLEALGLRHHQAEIVVQDTPSARGMLYKVRHLVRVTPEA
ncbi:MAG TPA: 50S ribosomal protein L30 [Gemmatimonadales bacterium]|jgi:large subunit ribosomal protein L30